MHSRVLSFHFALLLFLWLEVVHKVAGVVIEVFELVLVELVVVYMSYSLRASMVSDTLYLGDLR